jgi:hypothetical protein
MFGFIPATPLYENRVLATEPQITFKYNIIKDYPKKFDSFYNDHFGFRNSFILMNSLAMVKIFQTSPSTKVILGKNGWLYFAGEDEAFSRYQAPLTQKEVICLFQRMKTKNEWFKKKGIKFFTFVALNKQSIYPEYLKEPQLSWSKISRYQQFLDYYNENCSEDFFLDVKNAILIEKKKGTLVYYKTDSHWNTVSAFIAYTELFHRINKYFPEIKPLNLTDFTIEKQTYSGDLCKFIMNLSGFIDESNIFYQYQKDYLALLKTFNKEFSGLPLTYPLILSENKYVKTKTVIVIRDSQFDLVIPWFSECFSRVLYVKYGEKRKTILKLISKEKPFMVIDEHVERQFVGDYVYRQF